MALTHPSIRKLLRECFDAKEPLRADPADPGALLARVRERFEGWSGVTDSTRLVYRPPQDDLPDLRLDVTLAGDGYSYWRGVHLYLHLDASLGLVLDCAGEKVPVGDLETIAAFVRACQAALQRQRAHQAKREKLRNLKAKAILAQVRQLARDEGFDFATETDSVKLKLYVRLADPDCARIDIPFSKFQEILPNLREGIRALRELQAAGIRFRIGRFASWKTWVDHKTLGDD